MNLVLNQKNKICLSIHFFMMTIILVLYFINRTFTQNMSDQILISIMLFVFVWIYFSSGYLGLAVYHPYRFFLLVFFLYNIGGFVYSLFTGVDFLTFPFGLNTPEIYTKFVHSETLFSLIIFMLFVHLGVLVFLLYTQQSTMNITFWKDNDTHITSTIGLLIFYISILPAYYYFFSIIKEAFLLGGYQNYAFTETEGTLKMPFFIRISDDLFKFGFWLYLSTVPKRSKLILPTILFFLPFLLMSFFTGSRVHAIVQGVTLVTYFAIVKYINVKNMISFMLIFVVFAIFVGIIRGTQDYDIGSVTSIVHDNEINPVEEFFLTQGVSAHTIALTVVLVETHKMDYSLRFLYEPLFSHPGYQPNKKADDYYVLSDRISYYFTGNFENGGGLGSSIVAEFYAIGGIFGVMFFSFCFGFILLWLLFKINNPVGFLFLLLLLPGIYYTPRGHPLTPLIFAEQQIVLMLCFLLFKKFITIKK